jgi:hypothetical protein
MRRLLFGLFVGSCTAAGARAADEVVATTQTRQPVAVSISRPVEQAPLSSRGVSLGQPRLARGTRPEQPPAAGLVQVGYRGPARAAVASLPETGARPEALPPTIIRPEGDSQSQFAIERAAYLPAPTAVERVAGTAPVPAKAEKLSYGPTPMQVVPNPLSFGPTAGPGTSQQPSGGPTDGQPPEHLAMMPESAEAPALADETGAPVDLSGGPQAFPFRFYGSVEYLAWRVKDGNIPPLATTSIAVNPALPGPGQPPAGFGPLGDPTTRVLVNDKLGYGTQSGARFRLGYNLPTCKPMAIEGSFFFLNSGSSNFQSSQSQLYRPFFNGNLGFEDVQIVSSPGLSAGRITINSPSRLYGADLNLRCPLFCTTNCAGGFNLDLLGGFRYLHLNEGLTVTEQGIGQGINAGQAFVVQDNFRTSNNFYGAQVGLAGTWTRDRWSLGVRGTIAVGDTHQVVRVNGGSLLLPNSLVPMPGGLLALPSNIGERSKDRLSFVPEVGVNVGYRVTDWMRATVGYNFLYWSSVVRPGDQIDRVLDVTQVPGLTTTNAQGQILYRGVPVQPLSPPRPAPLINDTSFWAQGVTLGLEFRW